MKLKKERLLWFCVLSIALCILAACTPATVDLLLIPERNYTIEKQDQVIIDLPNGKIEIIYSDTNQVALSGTLPEKLAEELIVEENHTGLSIYLSDQAQQLKRSFLSNLHLKITVPFQTYIESTSFDGNLSATGKGGDLSATSVGGSIYLNDFEGKAIIKANRGAVSISNSSGNFAVFGNYGAITFNQVLGEITASTIMGQISYLGEPAKGDRLHFETDHGPVVLTIPLSANLAVAMNSVSGEVTCVFPDLENSSRHCTGMLGLGQADLFVRTVSGKITLQRGQ